MALNPSLVSVRPAPPGVVVPDTPSSAWSPSFPSADLVSAAAGLLSEHRVEDRSLGVTLAGLDVSTPSGRTSRTLYPPTSHPTGPAGASHWPRQDGPSRLNALDREQVEGPRWRIMVSPGTVSVRYQDPVRRDRTHERMVASALSAVDDSERTPRGGAGVTVWSSKSRSRMAEIFAQLDWSPMFADAGLPAMWTLTYPRRWLDVAPSAGVARGHLLLLRKRFERKYDRRLRGVWKREFQDRRRRCGDCLAGSHEHADSGRAPHWHLLAVVPQDPDFHRWLAETWADIVSRDPENPRQRILTDEERDDVRYAHMASGTLSYADGLQANDPKSVGIYFAKHGSFGAKEYQNEAPAEWVDQGSVGRFWGVWGLDKAVAGALVAPSDARAAVRTLRRLSRANSYVTRVPMWRYRTVVDPETGEISARWRKSSQKRRVYRMKGEAGYLVVKDGPAVAGQLARHLDQLRGRGTSAMGPSGAGPVGFLP